MEPSPEAKQAAGEGDQSYWIKFADYFEKREGFVPARGDSRVEELFNYYCVGVFDTDAATAKLREELEDERTLRISYGEQLRRFEFAHQQPSKEEQAETAAGMRQNKMWHQQPSATYKHEYADHLPGKDFSDLRATTPEDKNL